MKISKISLFLTLITILLVGTSESEVAFAGDWNVGVYLGAPIGFNSGYYPHSYYGAPYYGTPVYYPPAPAYYPAVPAYYPAAPAYYPPVPAYYPAVQPAPVIYTERKDSSQINTQGAPINSAQAAQESWWYYCVDAKTYYPYVKQCPGGWLRVAPQPAPGSGSQPALNSSPKP